MYQKTNICIETYGGLLVVDGWILKDQDWNGWVIPYFDRVAAKAIADIMQFPYNDETDTYTETERSAVDCGWFDSWTGGFNLELGEHVYCIGAMSWCWDDITDEELKQLDMTIIDRRTK